MALRCKDCGKVFPLAGRISEEKVPTPTGFLADTKRVITEAPCCPFCQSKNIEEVRIPIPEIPATPV